MRRRLRPAFVLTAATAATAATLSSAGCCPSSPPAYDDWCLSALPRTCSYTGSCSPYECRDGRWVMQHTCNPPAPYLAPSPATDAGATSD